MKKILSLLLICACLCGCLCACAQERTIVRLKSGSILFSLFEGYAIGDAELIDMYFEPYTTSDPAVWKGAVLWEDRYKLEGKYVTQNVLPGTILQKDWFVTDKPEDTASTPTYKPPTTNIPDIDDNQTDKPPVSEEKPLPTYELVYTNNGAYVSLSREDILSHIAADWNNADAMAAADAAKIEYFAVVRDISVRIKSVDSYASLVSYSVNNTLDLFDTSTDYQLNVSRFVQFSNKHHNFYPQEAYKAVLNAAPSTIEISMTLRYGTAQSYKSESITITGNIKLRNDVDESQQPVTTLRLTDTGCEIDVPMDVILKYSNWTHDELNANNANEQFRTRCVFTFGPAEFHQEQYVLSIKPSTRPDVLTAIITYKYVDAYEVNGTVLYKLALNPQDVYANLNGSYSSGKMSRYFDFYIKCTIIDARSDK